jgi:hypothetical protein
MNITKNTFSITIEFTDEEFKILSHDLLNPLDWIEKLVINKLANRKQALIDEWTKRLQREKSVESIPTDETALLDLIFSQKWYKNRTERERVL